MAPCAHPGTSSDVNEARGGLMLAAGRVRSKKKKIEDKKHGKKKPLPYQKHTTKASAARRPRPTRDGMRGNTSDTLAHTVPLP